MTTQTTDDVQDLADTAEPADPTSSRPSAGRLPPFHPADLAPPPASMAGIAEAVARYYDVDLATIRGPSRRASVVLPRHVAMFLARRHTKKSFDEVGEYFTWRDHTTVLHAIDKINARLRTDRELGQQVRAIEAIGFQKPKP